MTLVGITYYGCALTTRTPTLFISLLPGGLTTSLLTMFLFLLLSAIAHVALLITKLSPAFKMTAAADRVKEFMDVPV